MKRVPVTIDIETIPGQKPGEFQRILEALPPVKAPSGATKAEMAREAGLFGEELEAMTKEDVVAFYEKFKSSDRTEEAMQVWKKQALDGAKGEIFCIGIKIDDDETVCLNRKSPDVEDERRLIETFNVFLQKIKLPKAATAGFVGHNIYGFDLPFLFKRHVLHGVAPYFDLQPAKYSGVFYDTMLKWCEGGNSRIGLSSLCEILGIESSKNGIDGSQVFDMVCQGRHAEIFEYCKGDVEDVCKVFQKMTFGKGFA